MLVGARFFRKITRPWQFTQVRLCYPNLLQSMESAISTLLRSIATRLGISWCFYVGAIGSVAVGAAIELDCGPVAFPNVFKVIGKKAGQKGGPSIPAVV